MKSRSYGSRGLLVIMRPKQQGPQWGPWFACRHKNDQQLYNEGIELEAFEAERAQITRKAVQ
ncbi:MAG: hypothetical protein HW388_1480 [Dehalococcoidia bacterium]|nr:hypothetical protein [Dehalococcoidia bacterium]